MEFKLPIGLVSPADIKRLARELASFEESQIGQPRQTPISAILEDFARLNNLNLADRNTMRAIHQSLDKLLQTAPVLTISFAAEPSSQVIERILGWMRQQLNPHILLVIGLSPSIAAGCILRTPNKVFDMSISEHMKRQEPYLTELINATAVG